MDFLQTVREKDGKILLSPFCRVYISEARNQTLFRKRGVKPM